MALQPFCCALASFFQFRNLFYTDGRTLDECSARRKACIYTQDTTNRINAHTNINASSRTRNYDPSVRASEDISCLAWKLYAATQDTALDRSATVTGIALPYLKLFFYNCPLENTLLNHFFLRPTM
jgi:hypothetical protein